MTIFAEACEHHVEIEGLLSYESWHQLRVSVQPLGR